MSLTKHLLLALLFITTSTVHANPNLVVHCPSEIQITEKLTSPISGWRLFAPSVIHKLSGIELYEGDPYELASLKPDSTTREKAEWHFQPTSSIYVVCQYSATSLQLTQPLPRNIIGCTLSYNLMVQGDHGFVPERLVCR
jgi:hypothetical protein